MTLKSNTDQIVSFDDELLILVDEKDNEIGWETKEICHNGNGILHRAFSIFIFNPEKKLLLQKRSAQKRLWPLFWSNSCCSHPRKGESNEYATGRRLQEELGLKTALKFIYKFQYQVPFNTAGAENEMCSVYIGSTSEKPTINPSEIADWKYISIADLNKEMNQNPELFTPWFKMEWQHLSSEFSSQIQSCRSIN